MAGDERGGSNNREKMHNRENSKARLIRFAGVLGDTRWLWPSWRFFRGHVRCKRELTYNLAGNKCNRCACAGMRTRYTWTPTESEIHAEIFARSQTSTTIHEYVSNDSTSLETIIKELVSIESTGWMRKKFRRGINDKRISCKWIRNGFRAQWRSISA